MIELARLYVSGFWPWLGLTCGLWILVVGLAGMLATIGNAIITCRTQRRRNSEG